jgi:hypothetical protein
MFLFELSTTNPSLKIFGVVEVLFSNFASLINCINWKSIWIFKSGRAHIYSVAQVILPGHRPKWPEAIVYMLQHARQATAAPAPHAERSVGRCRWIATRLPTSSHLFHAPTCAFTCLGLILPQAGKRNTARHSLLSHAPPRSAARSIAPTPPIVTARVQQSEVFPKLFPDHVWSSPSNHAAARSRTEESYDVTSF